MFFEDDELAAWIPPTELPTLPSGYVGFDLECRDNGIGQGVGSSWPWQDGHILGIALSWAGTDDTRGSTYIPIRHPGTDCFDPDRTLLWLRTQFKRSDITWCMMNALYDFGWMLEWPVGKVQDVQVMGTLLNENRMSYSLDSLGKHYLGRSKLESKISQYAKDRGWKNAKENLWRMPGHVVGPYAQEDGLLTLDLSIHMRDLIAKDNLEECFKLEHDLQPVLWKMRRQGVRVDLDGAERLKVKYGRRSQRAVKDLKELSGVAISPWETEGLAKALLWEGITPPMTAGKNAQPSITVPLLNGWVAKGSKVAALILEARKYDRAKGTFIEGHFLNHARNGRVHPELHPLKAEREDGSGFGTVSYRFSCSGPNLQQLPGRDDELTGEIRGLALPEEGERWLSSDYSQQEPRLAIHYAKLMKVPGGPEAAAEVNANSETWDFHDMAARITGVPRKKVKNISLGRMYGAGSGGCAILMGLPTKEIQLRNGRKMLVAGEEAQAMMDEYDEKFPWVKAATEKVKQTAESRGWIRLLGGYKARFAVEPGARGEFPHKAFNRLVQGGSAAQTKLSIIYYAQMAGRPPLVTVHDENNVSGGARERKFLQESMLAAFADVLQVPMRVDIAEGSTWGEAALADD